MSIRLEFGMGEQSNYHSFELIVLKIYDNIFLSTAGLSLPKKQIT
jgi:hypothetical protein